MCDWRVRRTIERWGGLWRRKERAREEVKGVVHVELRQMSGIDEARSNTDTQLGCNNKTCSFILQSLVHPVWTILVHCV